MANQGAPAAGYKFNSFQEIKSHSSILYNERMAVLFYMLDMRSIDMNTYYRIGDVLNVRSLIKQIYKNVRMLIRNNPTVRATLNLDTKDSGIYVTDVAMGYIDRMVEHCESQGYSTRKVYMIAEHLNAIEMMLKDILQYFHYFIRPEFHQKPDLEIATERYKEIADQRTVEELRAIVGDKHRIDFEGLGSSRIDLKEIGDDTDDLGDVEGEGEEEDEDVSSDTTLSLYNTGDIEKD